MQTLNGRLSEDSDNPCVFIFTTESNITCHFKPSTAAAKRDWVKDIQSILDSQAQMKKGTEDFLSVQISFSRSGEIYGLFLQSVSMYTYGMHKP